MAGESIAIKLAQVTKKHSNMFVAGSIFNMGAALCLFVPSTSFKILHVAPIPEAGFVTHLATLCVLLLGLGYYWASQDLPSNANVVLLGAMVKLAVVVAAVLDVLLGLVSWQALGVVSGDLVFAILFYNALQDLKMAKQE